MRNCLNHEEDYDLSGLGLKDGDMYKALIKPWAKENLIEIIADKMTEKITFKNQPTAKKVEEIPLRQSRPFGKIVVTK